MSKPAQDVFENDIKVSKYNNLKDKKNKTKQKSTRLCNITHTNNWIMPPKFTFRKQNRIIPFHP